MNRIEKKFEGIKSEGRKGLVGYLTAGDPDIERSENNIREAIDGGLDVLELGVPFSDPTADGPTIQEASQRALASGATVRGAIELVGRLRKHTDIPIVLFGYANPFFIYGYEKLCADAAAAGVDGFLVVDMPYEESGEMKDALNAHNLCRIPLIAPTTGEDRAALILEEAAGFVYYIMFKGVTGQRGEVASDVGEHIGPLREFTDLPIAVGFGISSGEQAREAVSSADAVVVGSALVEAGRSGRIGELVSDLSGALRS
jgi:tryptophan synthase alpha chain